MLESHTLFDGRCIRELLRNATSVLREADVHTPRLDAELLLAEVLQVERLGRFLEPEHIVPEPQREQYAKLVHRRREREPASYLLGRKEFWALDLEVGPGVLVPRPETELLVETAIQRLKGRSLGTVLDLCCGAAPLAIALGLELKPRRVVAVDLSREALRYAARNVRRYRLEGKVLLVQADLCEAFATLPSQVDLIVSNPPYIPSADVDRTMPEVSRYEPRLALDGGVSGLDITRRILEASRGRLAPGGAVLLETGAGLMPALLDVARQTGFGCCTVLRDLQGTERALWAEASG